MDWRWLGTQGLEGLWWSGHFYVPTDYSMKGAPLVLSREESKSLGIGTGRTPMRGDDARAAVRLVVSVPPLRWPNKFWWRLGWDLNLRPNLVLPNKRAGRFWLCDKVRDVFWMISSGSNQPSQRGSNITDQGREERVAGLIFYRTTIIIA